MNASVRNPALALMVFRKIEQGFELQDSARARARERMHRNF